MLTVITGAFVGLTVEMVKRAGHDISKPITVDGGKQRDITIHPPKPIPSQGTTPTTKD